MRLCQVADRQRKGCHENRVDRNAVAMGRVADLLQLRGFDDKSLQTIPHRRLCGGIVDRQQGVRSVICDGCGRCRGVPQQRYAVLDRGVHVRREGLRLDCRLGAAGHAVAEIGQE